MSATPHNGKEADFQLFMGLLDADRFEGRFREGVHKADVSDMMRRLTKEELLPFDGTPLFPERRAYTTSTSSRDREAELYAAVTHLRARGDEPRRSDGDDKRRNNVGFALQILQRRLASSPAAIHPLAASAGASGWRSGSPRSASSPAAAGCRRRSQLPALLDDDDDR